MKFDIERIASLARLYLTPNERRLLSSQLKSILDYAERIARAKIGDIPPTFQTTELKNIVREDKVDSTRSLTSEEALANAPDCEGGFFKIKPVR